MSVASFLRRRFLCAVFLSYQQIFVNKLLKTRLKVVEKLLIKML